MLKQKKCRMLLTAFGGLCMLAGGGTAGAALAAEFRAVMTGDNILTGGDTDGWGRTRIDVYDDMDRLCADLEVRSVGEVTAVNIYKGAEGEEGTPVIKLDTPDDNNDSDDCDAIGDTLADEIQANPGNFYVSVQTQEFPEGAIRGQLAPSAD